MTPLEFRNSGIRLQDLPTNERTAAICETAIERDPLALQFVPLPLRTVRMTRLACGQNPRAYSFAPAGVRADYALAVFALRRGGLIVWDKIPKEIIDYELCLAGVKGNGALLKVIPVKFKDYELCRTAFKRGGADIKDIPEAFLRESEFWEGTSIAHIPDEFKTFDLCLTGVRKCGNYLQYVPEDLKDIIICKAALAENAWAYRFVPERHHHVDAVREAYKKARASGAAAQIQTLERKIA